MVKSMYEDIPDMDFSPEGVKREYFLFREAQKTIKNLNNISKQEKTQKIKELYEYIIDYNIQYMRYSEEKLLKELQNNLRETDLLRKDYEADNLWKKFCIKKDFRKLETLN